MILNSVLAQIDAEIAKLTQVRSLLANTGKIADKIATRLNKKAAKAEAKAAKPSKAKKRRSLSPEARKRIADAQRKRWAALRAKAKK
jgi:hypothetical protein